MNQQYHVVISKGRILTRRPWKAGVEKYSSGGSDVSPAMFGEHERRQFLEPLGPFILVSIEDKQPAIAATILADGYELTDPETKVKSKWYVAGYYVRDDGAVYIMTPQPMNDKQFKEKLGLRIDLEGEWGNSFKVGKYLKRLFSHHREYIQGRVVKVNGNIVEVELPNKEHITIKYADHGKLTDGMSLVSSRLLALFNHKSKEGQGMRVTALSPVGFSKGHAMVKDYLKYDLVLFNSKKMLYGQQFTFGFDWLHDAGAVYTDIQSYVNFRFVDAKFLLNQADTYMRSVIAAVGDTEKLREMLQFYRIDSHYEQERDEDGDLIFIDREKDWTLLNALRHGVDIQAHPALVRRFFNLFTKTVMNCETNMRAPIDPRVGSARYAMADPSIFDVWGDPTLEGELEGNTVYCGGHIGDIAFHRQPNAHRGEHHIAQGVASAHLEKMDTGCFIFLSRDVGQHALGKLGGGDYDDRLMYYTDQSIIKQFRVLESDAYPVVTRPEKLTIKPRKNVFEDLLLRKPIYDRDQLLIMLDQMKEQGVSIGYVVNAVMQDTCITDHKAEILAYLKTLPSDIKVLSAIAWLENYAGSVLREPASRLEDTIDAVKKEGSDLKDIGRQIREWNSTYQVVARFFTRGGKFEGRVPQSRRGPDHPVIVNTSIDDEIDEVREHRRDLEELITRNSYQMMKPIAEELLTYPMGNIEPLARQLAVSIRQNYYNQWANLRSEIPQTNDNEQARLSVAAYNKIDKSLYDTYGHNPLILDAMVLLYISVYERRRPDAPLQDDGTYKKFSDGILWGSYMSNLTIRMLEMVGLAGRYVPVQFDAGYSHLKYQDTIEATVENNQVRIEGTNEVIGTLNPSPYPDGHITIERGLVKVPAKDVYPYQGPEPKQIALSVVAGWEEKITAAQVRNDQEAWLSLNKQLAEWRAQTDKKVMLVPFIYNNSTTGEDEHAVRVLLDGVEYGNITRADAIYVTKNKEGWLYKGRSPKTMVVVIED